MSVKIVNPKLVVKNNEYPIIVEGFDMVGKSTYIKKLVVFDDTDLLFDKIIFHPYKFSKYNKYIHSTHYAGIIADNSFAFNDAIRNAGSRNILLLDRNLVSYYVYTNMYPPSVERSMSNEDIIELAKSNEDFLNATHIVLQPNDELSLKIYQNTLNGRELDYDDTFSSYKEYKLYFDKFYELAYKFYKEVGITPIVLTDY